MPVAAAASVPVSSTSRTALWKLWGAGGGRPQALLLTARQWGLRDNLGGPGGLKVSAHGRDCGAGGCGAA